MDKPKPKPSALDKAMRLLGRRTLTERELLNKLCAAEYPFPEARNAVAECRRRGYVNDEQFATDYTEVLSQRGLGGRRIKTALYKRGIPAVLQEAPLENAAATEIDRAREALEYKMRLLQRETDRYKRRDKAMRFLLGRGFSFDSCRTVIEESLNREPE